ncbi:MAG: hypothetical protein ACK5UI_01825 [Bacteroidota bacterium]|jgi:hypothetical protein
MFIRKLLVLTVSVFSFLIAFAQQSQQPLLKDSITNLGVAVAPSMVKFTTIPGYSDTKYVTITNDTKNPEKFKISVTDYDMSDRGAVTQLPANVQHEYGISKWISISPSFVELKPGEAKKIAITLAVPDSANCYRAGWTMLMIDQMKERQAIAPKNADGKAIAMGIIPTFGFAVYMFQNPPNVKVNKLELTKLKFVGSADTTQNSKGVIYATAFNTGDGLGFSRMFIELTNINNGYKTKLSSKQFTIFPKKERNFDFTLPGELPPGKYIASVILDFGSDETLEAAELEFEIGNLTKQQKPKK